MIREVQVSESLASMHGVKRPRPIILSENDDWNGPWNNPKGAYVSKCFQEIETHVNTLHIYRCILFSKLMAIIQRLEANVGNKIQVSFIRLFALCEWDLDFNFTVNY